MKRKKRELETLTKDEWRTMIGRLPQGGRFKIIFSEWDDGRDSYYAEQNQRLYRIRHRDGISLLNVFQLRCYTQSSGHGDTIEPVVVEDNVARSNVYAVIFLDNPLGKKKVEKMEMYVVLRDPDYAVGQEEWEQGFGHKRLIPKHQIDHLVEEVTRCDRPSSPSSSPLWSDADIFIDFNRNHAELWYSGRHRVCPRIAVSRAYGLAMYRDVLFALEQEQGRIYHRVSSMASPPILDTGR